MMVSFVGISQPGWMQPIVHLPSSRLLLSIFFAMMLERNRPFACPPSLKTRSYLATISLDPIGSIPTNVSVSFYSPLSLYLFLSRWPSFSRQNTRKCLGEISEIYIYVSLVRTSSDFGRYLSVPQDISSAPFSSPTEYRRFRNGPRFIICWDNWLFPRITRYVSFF